MDLFCPHCTRRVTIGDDKAGQVLSCPLCAKQFMAPALAPAPVVPKPPPEPIAPAPVETSYGVGPAPAPPPPSPMPPPRPWPPEPTFSAPPPPPLPPGSYTRSCSCQLTGEWLAFVPPVCTFLILVFSFFPWHHVSAGNHLALWGLAFVNQHRHFVCYTILFFPALLLAIASLPFDKGWVPPPPPIAPFLPLKNLVLGLILGLALLMLCVDWVQAQLVSDWNPQLLSLKLAFCLHFLATAASFLMFWVHWRKKSNLPPPTCDMRW